MCTVSSSGSKKINRRLLFNADENTSKRNRIPSDSESDDDIRPCKKKNRFINSDLSVEFESNNGKMDLAKSDNLTSESENINYDVSFFFILMRVK